MAQCNHSLENSTGMGGFSHDATCSNHTPQYSLSFQYCFHVIDCSMHAQSRQKVAQLPFTANQQHTTHGIPGLSDNGVNNVQSWDFILRRALEGKGETNITHSRRTYLQPLHTPLVGSRCQSCVCVHEHR